MDEYRICVRGNSQPPWGEVLGRGQQAPPSMQAKTNLVHFRRLLDWYSSILVQNWYSSKVIREKLRKKLSSGHRMGGQGLPFVRFSKDLTCVSDVRSRLHARGMMLNGWVGNWKEIAAQKRCSFAIVCCRPSHNCRSVSVPHLYRL